MYLATRDTRNYQSELRREESRVAIPKDDHESAKSKLWPIKTAVRLGLGPHQISIGILEHLAGMAGYATIDANQHVSDSTMSAALSESVEG